MGEVLAPPQKKNDHPNPIPLHALYIFAPAKPLVFFWLGSLFRRQLIGLEDDNDIYALLKDCKHLKVNRAGRLREAGHSGDLKYVQLLRGLVGMLIRDCQWQGLKVTRIYRAIDPKDPNAQSPRKTSCLFE